MNHHMSYQMILMTTILMNLCQTIHRFCLLMDVPVLVEPFSIKCLCGKKSINRIISFNKELAKFLEFIQMNFLRLDFFPKISGPPDFAPVDIKLLELRPPQANAASVITMIIIDFN